jgi:secernin
MCDSLVTIGDDGVMFAKNSDRDPNECQVLEWVQAADHGKADRLSCTWIEIPQVAHTHAVLISRPWWTWGAEMGTNEHGVVVGNEAVFTKGPPGDKALLGMDLVRLALERAARAEDAVEIIIRLLEAHGQGGPCSHERPGFTYDNSYLVADPLGAFVVETAGKEWAVEEVAGPGRSLSNGLTIPGFARAHGHPFRTWRSAASVRRRFTEPLACRAADPADLMAVLRSHGRTPTPRWSLAHGGLVAPCVHAGGALARSQTTASWVSDLRRGHRHWATGSAAPCTSLFKPVQVDTPVDLGPDPTNRYDDKSVWWRHELLHRSTMAAHGSLMSRYRYARDRVESRWFADPPTSAEAFLEADRLERKWLADVAASHVEDNRPAWVRWSWRAIDRAADIDRQLVP